MSFKQSLPLLLLLSVMAVAYGMGLGEFLTFTNIKAHRETLLNFTEAHPWRSSLSFILVYLLTTALSIPGAAFLSILGGFLFPQPWSTFFVVTGATLGALLLFLAAKTALGPLLKSKSGGILEKISGGFQENASSYLLFLRLVPAFPFWAVNLAPAFFGVPLFTFFWTTFLGIIPGAFVFTQAGAGLGAVFEGEETFSIGQLLNPDIKIALIALGIFALIPIVFKWIKQK